MASLRRQVDDQRDDEDDDSRDQRSRQRTGDKPRHHPDHAAGRGRAKQPPQYHTQDAGQKNGSEQGKARIDIVYPGETRLLRRGHRRRQFLTVDYPDDTIDAGGNAAGKIPAPESRRDYFVDDALGGGVVERAFKTVADLDAKLAVVLGDQQQRTVVDLLAPDLPGFRNPYRIL